MDRTLLPATLALAGVLAVVPPVPAATETGTPVEAFTESRPVDIVVAIDVSASMEDLLDSTRARLWDVVNELGRMRPTPDLRVGLISFGGVAGTEAGGWILVESDLTYDLDTVYGALQDLHAEGSHELVGRALDVALEEMSWSHEPGALRVIFVAGNESADQGVSTHDFRVAARRARERGIVINSLYAGLRDQGVSDLWPEIAQAGAGNFSAIDPSLAQVQVQTPFDTRLLELNAELNTTYVPYGEEGAVGLANQTAQDNNASRLGVESCSSRIVAKGSALYTNASWDLVDATLQEDFSWDALSVDDYPEEMRTMTELERIAYVDGMRAIRETVQEEIQAISDERETFLRAHRAKAMAALSEDLGEAMREAIRQQAQAAGFECEGC